MKYLSNQYIPCSQEQMKIMRYLHEHEVVSIYALAKGLGRDFKNVYLDVQNLVSEKYIRLKKNRTKGRLQYKPIPLVDVVVMEIRLYSRKRWNALLNPSPSI